MLCNDNAKMGCKIAREDEWLQGMGLGIKASVTLCKIMPMEK